MTAHTPIPREVDARARRFLLALAHALGWEEGGPRPARARAHSARAARPAGVRWPAGGLQPEPAGGAALALSPAMLWSRRPWGEGTRPSRLSLQRGRLVSAGARTPRGRHDSGALRIEVYEHDEPVVDGRHGLWSLLASLWPPARRRLQTRLTTWWLTYTAPDGQAGVLHLTLGRALDGTPRYWALDALEPRFTLYADGAGASDLAALHARCLARGVRLYRPRAGAGAPRTAV